MTGAKTTGLRVAVLVAWLGGLMAIGVAEWSSDGAVITAAGPSVIAGLLVGRWWALAAAPAICLALLGYIVLAGGPGRCLTMGGVASVIALATLLVDTPLGVGVGLRRLIDLGRRPRPHAR